MQHLASGLWPPEDLEGLRPDGDSLQRILCHHGRCRDRPKLLSNSSRLPQTLGRFPSRRFSSWKARFSGSDNPHQTGLSRGAACELSGREA